MRDDRYPKQYDGGRLAYQGKKECETPAILRLLDYHKQCPSFRKSPFKEGLFIVKSQSLSKHPQHIFLQDLSQPRDTRMLLVTSI